MLWVDSISFFFLRFGFYIIKSVITMGAYPLWHRQDAQRFSGKQMLLRIPDI